jgi:hypothetical protein
LDEFEEFCFVCHNVGCVVGCSLWC